MASYQQKSISMVTLRLMLKQNNNTFSATEPDNGTSCAQSFYESWIGSWKGKYQVDQPITDHGVQGVYRPMMNGGG